MRAEDAVAPFDVVEIDLQNPLLAEELLQQHRQQQFLALARQVALAREKQVLGELLRDRRAAADLDRAQLGVGIFFESLGREFFGLGIALPGLVDGVPIDPVVVDEAVVFRGDDGTLERVGDLGIRYPLLTPVQLAIVGGELLPELRALEGGGLGIDHHHQRDAQHKKQLQGDECQHHQNDPACDGFDHGVVVLVPRWS